VVDQTATAVKTMRYKPYGEVLSRSGSISDRMYQWVGTYGYRATFNYASSHYVRARHYSQTPGTWTTVDPTWPSEPPYTYVSGNVVTVSDPLGLNPLFKPSCDSSIGTLNSCCDKLLPRVVPPRTPEARLDDILQCMASLGWDKPKKRPLPEAAIRNALKNLENFCTPGFSSGPSTVPGYNVCVFCARTGNRPSDYPPSCADPCKGGDLNGRTPLPWARPPGGLGRLGDTGCDAYFPENSGPNCQDALRKAGCNSAVVLCKPVLNGKDPFQPCLTLFHELIHVGGIGHAKGGRTDFIYALTCCMCKTSSPTASCNDRCNQFKSK